MKLKENSLKTCGLYRPAIDSNPLFSWKLLADKNGEKQDAYRITVTPDGADNPVWDSGRIESEESINIAYQGEKLTPMTRYHVSLTVWAGEDILCDEEYFDTGKRGTRFGGIWITAAHCIKRDEILGAPALRRTFHTEKEIKRAMLYIAGLGYFEARINGEKVGDDFLSIPFTAYDKHILYRIFDVTEMLRTGDNAIGVLLGNGFYNCFTADPWQTATAPWRDVPKLLLDLRMEYTDGTSAMISSDLTNWKTHESPITFNGIRHGESYDARLEEDGWDTADFDDSDWKLPRRVKNPGAVMTAMEMEPIRVRFTFPAIEKRKVPEGWLFDIGQNQAGVCRITFRGKRGDKITVRYCDILDENGSLDQEPLACFIKNYCFQTETYIKRTDEPETWHARFTYHGYRYVELSGCTEEPQLSDVTALALCNDFDDRGEFETSNEDLNYVQHMSRFATTSCCMHTLSADAVREKSSWTGDTGLSAEQLLLNFGADALMRKWQDDMRESQRPCGTFPCIVPSAGWGYNSLNGPDWSHPMVDVPWNLYTVTGNLDILRENYDALCRHVSYIDSMAENEIASYGLGDWCAPFEGEAVSVNMESFKCPVPVTDTAFYHSAVRMAAKWATLLGHDEDALYYTEKADGIKKAFREKFYDEKTHTVMGDCQTATGVMIYHGLANENEIPALVRKLEEQIEACDGHLDYGVLGSKAVLSALGENGKTDLAIKMITNPTYPSYTYWAKLGATTLLECWNGLGSRNQHMFSNVSAFFYHYIGGIFALEAGYKKILLRPAVNCGLDYVHASIDTPYGIVCCDFKRENGILTLHVDVPVGTEALLSLPEKDDILLVSGHHVISEQNH